ncbi:MAG: hypothetical protein AAGD35_12595 [Actinomycetota bacterium]
MTDFEPQTDLPDVIDDDDAPVESSARLRDLATQNRRKRLVQLAMVGIGAGLFGFGYDPLRVLGAVAIMYLIIMSGMAILGSFARPIPAVLPPGELRKVKLIYRCSTCGAELRMTLAPDRLPQPPRHCADEMELMTPLEDL